MNHVLLPAIALWTLGAVGWAHAQQVQRNRAAESDLPRGQGFADRYPGDAGIADDPRVIFADNFETGDWSRWDQAANKNGDVLSLVDQSASDPRMGRHSLQVTARLSANTGGSVTKWFQPTDPVFIRYYVKFAADCDYTHHLVRLRANKGLRGSDKWTGFGGAGIKPRGDERFTTGIEPWAMNRRLPPPGKWAFYSYWHTMQPDPRGDYWGNHFLPADQPPIERDRWYCCELMLKHNTPGQADGEQAMWIDGELLGHWQGINWRTADTLWANCLVLESYVTDRWTRQETNTVYFDNAVIAREYIGPSGGTEAAGAQAE